MEYLKYYPDDVPSKSKKIQLFELGFSYEIQKHIESNRYATLDQLYKRAAQIGNVIRKEKEKAWEVGDKRKEPMEQSSNPNLTKRRNQPSNFKKTRSFAGYQGNAGNQGSSNQGGGNQWSEGKHQKPLLDDNGKERVYNCKKCSRNHPGKDYLGNLVDCTFCGKRGHRIYECYAKQGQ